MNNKGGDVCMCVFMPTVCRMLFSCFVALFSLDTCTRMAHMTNSPTCSITNATTTRCPHGMQFISGAINWHQRRSTPVEHSEQVSEKAQAQSWSLLPLCHMSRCNIPHRTSPAAHGKTGVSETNTTTMTMQQPVFVVPARY